MSSIQTTEYPAHWGEYDKGVTRWMNINIRINGGPPPPICAKHYRDHHVDKIPPTKTWLGAGNTRDDWRKTCSFMRYNDSDPDITIDKCGKCMFGHDDIPSETCVAKFTVYGEMANAITIDNIAKLLLPVNGLGFEQACRVGLFEADEKDKKKTEEKEGFIIWRNIMHEGADKGFEATKLHLDQTGIPISFKRGDDKDNRYSYLSLIHI